MPFKNHLRIYVPRLWGGGFLRFSTLAWLTMHTRAVAGKVTTEVNSTANGSMIMSRCAHKHTHTKYGRKKKYLYTIYKRSLSPCMATQITRQTGAYFQSVWHIFLLLLSGVRTRAITHTISRLIVAVMGRVSSNGAHKCTREKTPHGMMRGATGDRLKEVFYFQFCTVTN